MDDQWDCIVVAAGSASLSVAAMIVGGLMAEAHGLAEAGAA